MSAARTAATAGAGARQLSAAALEEATARYTGVGALRGLLTHDAALGGVPIKLLSARWVLDFFQAAANASARLEHRQALEREHPEAFVAGEAVQRLLAEVEAGKNVAEAPGGGYEALQRTEAHLLLPRWRRRRAALRRVPSQRRAVRRRESAHAAVVRLVAHRRDRRARSIAVVVMDGRSAAGEGAVVAARVPRRVAAFFEVPPETA